MNIGFSTANTFIFGIENLLVFWLAAKMIMASQIGGGGSIGAGGAPFTIDMMFAFISYKGPFTGRITALINYAVQIRMLSLHAERPADIALTEAERDTPQGNLPDNDLAHLAPSLELRNVSFRYGEGKPWVLLGILKPKAGEVLYGGVPVRQLGLTNVRRRSGTVMQPVGRAEAAPAAGPCHGPPIQRAGTG